MSVSVQATTRAYFDVNINSVTQSFSVSASASSYGYESNVDNLVELASKLSLANAFQDAIAYAYGYATEPSISIYINNIISNIRTETSTIIVNIPV